MEKLKGTILLIVGLIFAGTCLATDLNDPQIVVKQTADEIFQKISSQKETLKTSPEKLYEIVYEVIAPKFDLVSISKWILGKKVWKMASEEHRQQFMEEFRSLLVRLYARSLLDHSGNEIEYLGTESTSSPNLAVVKTKFQLTESSVLLINYRMYRKENTWKVLDVVVDGISLVSTYRASFADEIKSKGLEGLIDTLKERNEKNKLEG